MAQRVRRQLEARARADEPHVAVRRARGQPASGPADEQRPLALGRDLLALLEPLVEDLAHERVERDLTLDLALAQDDEHALAREDPDVVDVKRDRFGQRRERLA